MQPNSITMVIPPPFPHKVFPAYFECLSSQLHPRTVVGYEFLYGMSSLMFSYSYWSALPLSIGLLLTSPIMFVTTWLGSILGVVSAIFMSPVWSDVSLKIYALQGAITLSSVTGNFFVLNFYSGNVQHLWFNII